MNFETALGRWRGGDDGAYNAILAAVRRIVISHWHRKGGLPESVFWEDYSLQVANKLLLRFRSPKWAPGRHGAASVVRFIKTAAEWAWADAWREEKDRPGAPPMPARRSKKKGADGGGAGDLDDDMLRDMDNIPLPRRPDSDFYGPARSHIFGSLYSLPEKDQEVLFVCGIGCVPDSTYARLTGTTTRNVSVWFSRASKRLLKNLGIEEADGAWLRDFFSGTVAITEGQIAGVADPAHRKLLLRLYAAPDPKRRARSLGLWLREVDNPKKAQRLLWAAIVSLMKTRRVLKGDPRRSVRAAMGCLIGSRPKRRR